MSLLVITPSYRPDVDLCRDLSASIRRFGPPGVAHQVIVPRRDLPLFSSIGDCRAADEFLPDGFLALPGNVWLNARRPWPPVRGWVAQQIVKLAAAARATEDVVLLVDSDLSFVRPFGPDTFLRDGVVRFYRMPDAIDARLPRHRLWHQVARRLLGLPRVGGGSLPDYVGWPVSWDPAIVRACLARIEAVTGRDWASAIAGELHVSECILYGVFVDEVLGGSTFSADRMLSVAYSAEAPLDAAATAATLARLSPDDIAVMISARSGTDLAVRRGALAALGPRAA